MIWDVPIHLLGTRDQKGSGLERLMQTVLDKMGHRDIRSKIHKTGAEIDLKARHKVTNQRIMVECKGHAVPVASNDIKKTYAEFKKEQSQDSHLVCLFVSLNGYEGTCLEWYDELPVQDRQMFLLWSGADVLRMLADAQLIVGSDVVAYRINMLLGPVDIAWNIVLMRDQLYWVSVFTDKAGQRLFCVHDAQAHDILRPVAEDIARAEPKFDGAKYVSLKGETALLSALLDGEWWSHVRLAEHLTESEAEVSLHAGSLVARRILECYNPHGCTEVRLARDQLTFAQVADIFLCEDMGFDFVASPYGYLMLDETMSTSLLKRHRIEPEPGMAAAFSNALKVSPSALRVALAPVDPLIERAADRLLEMRSAGNLEGEDRNAYLLSPFMGRFLRAMIDDLNQSGRTQPLEKARVRAHSIGLAIKMATPQGRYLALSGQTFQVLMRADGAIEAGDIVGATADGLAEMANYYFAMEEFGLAEREYRRAIDAGLTGEHLAAVNNNLGLCYYRLSGVLGPTLEEIAAGRLSHLEAAHNALSAAISLDPSLRQAWFNRALVDRNLGRVDDALSDVRRALEIDADYPEAQQLLADLSTGAA